MYPSIYPPQIVDGLRVSGDKSDAKRMVQAMYKFFKERDCTLLEVNPLAEDANTNELIAAGEWRGEERGEEGSEQSYDCIHKYSIYSQLD